MELLLKGRQTERLNFRKIKQSDFNDWLPFFENPITHQYWNAKLESPKTECEKWYSKQFHRYENNLGGMNALIEKHSGKLIGHCGLLVQTVDNKIELEIGYSLLPQFWNIGYATEAAIKCRDVAFDNNLSESIISIISTTNKPSQAVALKIGMRKLKRTMYNQNEVHIFGISKREWKKLKIKSNG